MLTWKELKERNLEVVEVMDKIESSEVTMNVKQIRMSYENNKIGFENAMQRGKVWDDEKSSLLIHSILKNVPIYPIAAIKDGEVIDVLDGKQRLLKAVIEFALGMYELKGIPLLNMKLSNGEYDDVDLNGSKFEDLDEHLRDIIDACNFRVIMINENTSEEDIADLFFRWNNGKPLSAVELTRAKAKSQSVICELSRHELFKSTMTAKALASFKNEDIVTKTYFMLNEKEPDLETKHIRKEIVNIDITNEDKTQISAIYDRILAMRTEVEEILLSKNAKPKSAAAAAKKVVSKTHMISIIPFVAKTIESNLSVRDASMWFLNFYGEKASGSTSAIYNEHARGGSAKKTSIAKRHAELEKNYNAWYKKYFSDTKYDKINNTERLGIAKEKLAALRAEIEAVEIEDEVENVTIESRETENTVESTESVEISAENTQEVAETAVEIVDAPTEEESAMETKVA